MSDEIPFVPIPPDEDVQAPERFISYMAVITVILVILLCVCGVVACRITTSFLEGQIQDYFEDPDSSDDSLVQAKS